MARRPGRTQVVAFKADAEMAAFLASLPSASGFVRQAVLSALHRRCPLCRGAGRVPVGVGEHYAPLLPPRAAALPG